MPEFYKLQLITLLLLLGTAFGYSQTNDLAGIKFNSQNVPREQKTSLFLNEGNPIELNNSFSISFDISFWDFKRFGPILRIEDENKKEIRIIYVQFKNEGTSYIQIIEPYHQTPLEINIPKNKLTRNRWFNVKLAIDKNEKSLKAFWNNDFAGELSYPVEKQNRFKFAFGIKEPKDFNDYDVPAIVIKNIIISENDKIKYQWDLDLFNENPLTDKFEHLKIKAVNFIWLYQDSQKWRHIADYVLSDTTINSFGVAFDSVNSRLFIDRKKDLLIYNIITGKDSVVEYDSPSPAYWNELFYDDTKQQLYSFMNGMGKVSVFDLTKKKWVMLDYYQNYSAHYFGSAKFIYPEGDNLYLLGGYGWYSLKNDLFKYNFNRKEWEKVKLKRNEMDPHAWFALGKGFHKGEFLIYGGVGNQSGKQEEGFNNCYNYYLLNLNDSTIKKAKYPESQKFNYVSLANYLHLDKKDSTIYFLSKSREGDYFNINLNRLSLKTGLISKVGDTFWHTKPDNWTYYYLHYNRATNEFISVIFDTCKVELYSINYPPIPENIKVHIEEKGPEKINFLAILIPVIVLLGTGGFFIYQKKRNSKVVISSSDKKEEKEIFRTSYAKNSVNLFGGFCIYDNNGNEICQSLSPKLKEILLLILIKSINNHHSGITSEELSSTIWPDSSPENVKSSRGVAINKIRKALSTIEGLTLEFSDKLWSIKFSNGAICDYLEYVKLKTNQEKNYNSSENSLIDYLDIFSGGEFLKGISYSWLDSIKFAINNEVIIFLKNYFENDKILKDFDNCIKLCDIILLFDSVDQDAIKLKIKTLCSAGKQHIAKNSYNLFVSEYKRLYDENFPLSFEELVKS